MIGFTSYHQRIIFILCLLLVSASCTKEDPQRHLNLGNWYLQRGVVDEAIMEFREVSRLFSGDESKLKRSEFNILCTAHLKLAIAYTKKGWWEYALNEAKRSFEITPNKDCHDLIALIDEKLALKNNVKSFLVTKI